MTTASENLEQRNLIVERLLGDTGDPGHIVKTARALAVRALPAIRESLNEQVSYPIELELEAVELARLSEAKRDGIDNDVLVVASSATSPDALMLIADAGAVALLISALFGGDPDLPVTQIERELSSIELELASVVFEATAKALNGSGPRALTIKFPMQPAVTGKALKKLIIRDGPGVRLGFTMKAPSGTGRFVVMMPQRVLIAHRGDAVAGGEAAEEDTAWTERFGEEIMRSSVRVEASIPMSRMTLGELTELKVGDVIELPEEVATRTRLSARRMTLFNCEFGKLGQNFTVRVVEPFDAGQEFIDGLTR